MVTLDNIEKMNNRYKGDKIDLILGNGILTLAKYISASRLNMVITQLSQCCHLTKSEVARVSTGYEREYGAWSDGKKISDSNYRIVNKIVRHTNNPYIKYFLVLHDVITGEYTTIEIQKYTKMADKHGYMKDFVETDYLNVGNIIKKGDLFYSSQNHDKYGNYKYGLNAKVAYMATQDVSDDAVVISKSFAERGSHNTITIVEIPINSNDIMLNLFGEDGEFKFIPNIGEYIDDSKGILCAKRSIEYNKSASNITNSALKNIWNNDRVSYGRGMVLDFDIYVNNRKELESGNYRKQLKSIYDEQLRYNQEIVDALTPIINNRNIKKSELLIHHYNSAMRYINNSIDDGKNLYKYANNNGVIEFASLSVTLLYENQLKETSKITNRFGGKGVVTKVLEDEYMPRDKWGNVCDVLIAATSVVERANIGQLYEHELNFCADRVLEQMSKMKTNEEKMNHLLEFFYTFNKDQADSLRSFYTSSSGVDQTAFLNEIITTKNLVIHQPPFDGTVTFEQLKNIYDKFDIKPDYCRYRVEFDSILNHPQYVTQKQFDTHKRVAFNFPEGTKPNYLPTIEDIFRKKQMDNLDGKKGDKKMMKNIKDNIVSTKNGDYYMVGNEMGAGDVYRHNQKKSSILEELINYFKIIKETKEKIDEETFLKDETIITVNERGNLVRDFRTTQKIIIADEYIMVLKQNGESGFSARGTGTLNQTLVPVRNKKENGPFSKIPVKVGSMETDNLLRRLNPRTVLKFIAQRSSNMHYRQRINEMLLTQDPFDSIDLEIPEDELFDSIPAKMLDEHLKAIGIEILLKGTEDIHEFFDNKEMFPTHDSVLKYLEEKYQEMLKESEAVSN